MVPVLTTSGSVVQDAISVEPIRTVSLLSVCVQNNNADAANNERDIVLTTRRADRNRDTNTGLSIIFSVASLVEQV